MSVGLKIENAAAPIDPELVLHFPENLAAASAKNRHATFKACSRIRSGSANGEFQGFWRFDEHQDIITEPGARRH
jgi:hypothetical protein